VTSVTNTTELQTCLPFITFCSDIRSVICRLPEQVQVDSRCLCLSRAAYTKNHGINLIGWNIYKRVDQWRGYLWKPYIRVGDVKFCWKLNVLYMSDVIKSRHFERRNSPAKWWYCTTTTTNNNNNNFPHQFNTPAGRCVEIRICSTHL
jgi:hypothetical protein